MDFSDVTLQLIGSTIRMSIPMVFAAMAGVISERSGVINIALEGFVLIGAFFAAVGSLTMGSPWAGLGLACLSGLVLAAAYALFVIDLRADQIVAGTAINMLAFGTAPLLCKMFFNSASSSPAVELVGRFQVAPLWIGFALVLGVWAWLRWTPGGLWLQFAGEHPEALECGGIRVRRIRWLAVMASGCIAAAGGATLSIFLSSSFSRGMSGGRGFMALAAMIFGRWKPIPAALACILFGFTEAVQMQLQGVNFPGTSQQVPVQLIQIIPYLATVVVLASFVGRSYAPKSLGKAYQRS